jgi:hypothetical protein
MFKKLLSTTVLAFYFCCSFAQTENLLSFSVSELGPSFEASISENISAKLQLGIYASSQVLLFSSGMSTESKSYLFLHAGANGSFRYYYNFSRRSYLGKNTSRNSANYFAISNLFLTTPFANFGAECECRDSQDIQSYTRKDYNKIAFKGLTSGIVWGMQRSFDKRINIDLNGGVGYSFNENIAKLMLTATIGIWLGSNGY